MTNLAILPGGRPDHDGDLPEMLASWERSLRAARKSERTVETYLESGNQLLEHLVEKGHPLDVDQIRREHVESYLLHLGDKGSKPATVSVRYRALALFFRYLATEEDIEKSPMANMTPPSVPDVPVPIVTPEQQLALMDQCNGKDFESRRDLAIIAVLIDTGVRKEELAGVQLDAVELYHDHASIRVLGKGGRERTVELGPTAVVILDRYMKARKRHPHAHLPWLWLGRLGRYTSAGISQMLRKRGRAIGIPNLHAHQFRHSFADSWLDAGGSEGHLMHLAGWKSRSMMDRYGASNAAKRARKAHRSFSPLDRVVNNTP